MRDTAGRTHALLERLRAGFADFRRDQASIHGDIARINVELDDTAATSG